jgi:murein hydrolase activator
MVRKIQRYVFSSLCSPVVNVHERGRNASGSGSLLLVITVVILLAFPVISTGNPTIEEKQKLETGINKYRINIRRLQQGIRLQQEEMEQSLSKERDLLAELENIDIRLQEHREKLLVLQGRMATQQDLITVKEKELTRVKADKHAVQVHLQKRLSAYYKMGRIGLINVAFSAQTLPELLAFDDSFHSLIGYDQNLIDSYRKSISEMEKVKEALTLERTLLQEFIAQGEEEKNQIDATKKEKENLLALIRTQTKLHERAIKEMEDAAGKLTSSLMVMQKKEEMIDKGFLLNRGKLPLPVSGTIITLFNQEKTNNLGISGKSKGITIKAPDGTKVKAIFYGTVLFSDYLRGYGNTIIVDHGYQYYSIISRVEKLLKNKGDSVSSGDIIAVMGDTATLMEDGLYLEIRHEGESLDPLQWLDKEKVTIEAKEKKNSSEQVIQIPITTQ